MECCADQEPLCRLIYCSGQELRTLAERVLCPHALTVEQFHLLKELSTDCGLTQRRLGELVGKGPANLTRMLDRLEAKALVERRPDPADRRASLVFLTDQGKNLVGEVVGVFESFAAGLVLGISETEQQAIRVAFGKLRRNIEKLSREL